MKKILITGARGQLGNALSAISASYPGYHFNFIDIDTLDITREDEVAHYFRDNSFDICINTAAFTDVDGAENQKDLALQVNGEAVAGLAKICGERDILLVQLSTDYVFDGRHHRPYVESDRPSPDSVYGESKLRGEEAVSRFATRALIIRTSWLYSPVGKNFVRTIARLAGERDEIRVVDDQVGTPTSAADLADALMQMVVRPASQSGTEIFHYSNEGVTSWYDFAKAIVDTLGLNCRVTPIASKDYPMLANRPHYSVLSKYKIKETFGLEIPHWADSLKKVLLHLKNEQNH